MTATRTPNDKQLAALDALAETGQHNLASFHRATKKVLTDSGWATYDGLFHITEDGQAARTAAHGTPQPAAATSPRTLAARVTLAARGLFPTNANISTNVHASGTVAVQTDRQLYPSEQTQLAETVTTVMGTAYQVHSWHSYGSDSRYGYYELVTPAEAAARAAAETERIATLVTAPADEASDFTDRGTNRPGRVCRRGRHVFAFERDEDGRWAILSEKRYDTDADARVGYANWMCDEAAAQPRPGDVIQVWGGGPRGGNQMLTVTASRHRIEEGPDVWDWDVTGTDKTGTARTVRLYPGLFEYVSRPVTVKVDPDRDPDPTPDRDRDRRPSPLDMPKRRPVTVKVPQPVTLDRVFPVGMWVRVNPAPDSPLATYRHRNLTGYVVRTWLGQHWLTREPQHHCTVSVDGTGHLIEVTGDDLVAGAGAGPIDPADHPAIFHVHERLPGGRWVFAGRADFCWPASYSQEELNRTAASLARTYANDLDAAVQVSVTVPGRPHRYGYAEVPKPAGARGGRVLLAA